MTGTPKEREKFKALLEKTSLGGIRRALDTDRIWLPWKRELAEDEGARRTRQAEERQSFKTKNTAKQKRSRSQRSWMIIGILLVAVLSVIVVSVLDLWH